MLFPKLRLALARLTTSPTAIRFWQASTLLMAAAGLYLALSPAPPKTIDTGWDKTNHALAFICLSISAKLGWAGSRSRLFGPGLMLLAYGAAIEIAQLFVPTRSAEWADWLADALGIVIGAVLARKFLRAATRA